MPRMRGAPPRPGGPGIVMPGRRFSTSSVLLSPKRSISSRPITIFAALDWRRCSLSLLRPPVISMRCAFGAEAAAAGAAGSGCACTTAAASARPAADVASAHRRGAVKGIGLHSRRAAKRWRGAHNASMEPFTLLYEDALLLAADKPAGLLAVPGRGADKQDCLWSRVVARYSD